jgi:hypothetical protein
MGHMGTSGVRRRWRAASAEGPAGRLTGGDFVTWLPNPAVAIRHHQRTDIVGCSALALAMPTGGPAAEFDRPTKQRIRLRCCRNVRT